MFPVTTRRSGVRERCRRGPGEPDLLTRLGEREPRLLFGWRGERERRAVRMRLSGERLRGELRRGEDRRGPGEERRGDLLVGELRRTGGDVLRATGERRLGDLRLGDLVFRRGDLLLRRGDRVLRRGGLRTRRVGLDLEEAEGPPLLGERDRVLLLLSIERFLSSDFMFTEMVVLAPEPETTLLSLSETRIR